jgi:hypothetical protein
MQSMSYESLELEPARGQFKPALDERRHMPEPPPVRLVAVEDVHLAAVSGKAPELDALYVGLLRFEREPAEAALVYRAENFRLRFDVQRPPVERDDYRAAMIEVPDLAAVEKKLIEDEIEYERQRGLSPAHDQLVLRDPAGNWISLGEMRGFR